MGNTDDADQLQGLLQEGRHAEAAGRLRAAGQPARAREIYEKIWDFRAAAECAHEAGDGPAELKNLVDAGAWDEAAALTERLGKAGGEPARAAAAVLEGRRRFGEAAALREGLGHDEAAAALYQRAGQLVDAARLLERLGREREAGRLLERRLEQGAADAEVHLALGRVLARLGHHEPAARHLQQAGDSAEALRILAGELTALGLAGAAADALARARRLDPGAAAATPAEPASPGVVGGRYRLLRPLGAGATGRVFLAADEVSGAEVAIKLCFAAGARGPDGNGAYERFVREARIGLGEAAGRHPNIVRILELREDLGFFVMELMKGGTLADRLRPRAPAALVRRVARAVLAALAHAHARGVVHRDVKPANIFFDGAGLVKLGDFGVAHLLDLGQTQTGALIGTLAYMPPEQITGAPLSGAADLYALGVTLFQALTGRLPFLGPDYIAQHLGDAPPRPSETWPELGAAWDDLLCALLGKDPAGRPGTDEALAAIERLDSERTILVLPRPAAAASPEPEPRPEPAAAPAPPAPRYVGETPLGETAVSTLSRAVDRALGRSVVLERFHPGHPDEAEEARLRRLATSVSPYLQRILAFDREARTVVFEAPVGESLAARGEPPDPRWLARLARGLGPLHAGGGAHGAVSAERVLVDGDTLTLLCAGLGPLPERLSPADDAAACLALFGLSGDMPEAVERQARVGLLERHVAALAAAARALPEPERGRKTQEIRARALDYGLPAERVEALLTWP